MRILKAGSVLAVAFMVTLSSSAGFGAKGASLANDCKDECPNAKSDHEAHECVEKLEADGAADFKQSKCYKTHLEHEKAEKGKKHKGKVTHKHGDGKEDGHGHEEGHAH